MRGLGDTGRRGAAASWRINCHRVLRNGLTEPVPWDAVSGPRSDPDNGPDQPLGRPRLE